MINLFKKSWLKIIIVVVVMFFAVPAVTLGGSFVLSLIQGKTPAEAVEILAVQIDNLIGRMDILEERQSKQEIEEACRFADTALSVAGTQGGVMGVDSFNELISRIIYERDSSPQDQYQMWQARLEKVKSLNEQYIIAVDKCSD